MGNLPTTACHAPVAEQYATLRKQYAFASDEEARRHAQCPRIKEGLRDALDAAACDPGDQQIEAWREQLDNSICASSRIPYPRPNSLITIHQGEGKPTQPDVVIVGLWSGKWQPVIQLVPSAVHITPAAATDEAYHVLRWLALEIHDFHEFFHDGRAPLEELASVDHDDLAGRWDYFADGGGVRVRRGRWHLGAASRGRQPGHRRLLCPLDHDCETPRGVYLLIAVRARSDATDFVVLFLQRPLRIRRGEDTRPPSVRLLVFRESRPTPCLQTTDDAPLPYRGDITQYLVWFCRYHGGLIGAIERDIRQAYKKHRADPVGPDFLAQHAATTRPAVKVSSTTSPGLLDDAEYCQVCDNQVVARAQLLCCHYRCCGWCFQRLGRCPQCRAFIDRVAGVRYNDHLVGVPPPAASAPFIVYQVGPQATVPVFGLSRAADGPGYDLLVDHTRRDQPALRDYYKWLQQMFRVVPLLRAGETQQRCCRLLEDATVHREDQHHWYVAAATFQHEDDDDAAGPERRSLVVLQHVDGVAWYSAYVCLRNDHVQDAPARLQAFSARATATQTAFLDTVRQQPFGDAEVRAFVPQWLQLYGTGPRRAVRQQPPADTTDEPQPRRRERPVVPDAQPPPPAVPDAQPRPPEPQPEPGGRRANQDLHIVYEIIPGSQRALTCQIISPEPSVYMLNDCKIRWGQGFYQWLNDCFKKFVFGPARPLTGGENGRWNIVLQSQQVPVAIAAALGGPRVYSYLLAARVTFDDPPGDELQHQHLLLILRLRTESRTNVHLRANDSFAFHACLPNNDARNTQPLQRLQALRPAVWQALRNTIRDQPDHFRKPETKAFVARWLRIN